MQNLNDLKTQAKRLRASLEAQGKPVSHSEALELVARQLGYRDWNTLHASVGDRAAPAPVALGDRVHGTYLGQPFDRDVIGVQSLSQGRMRVTLEFDDPVDVVTFDSFSAYRKRVSATVDEKGRTKERTSDGTPQLQLRVKAR
jgi:hypothetical protein